MSAQCIFPSNPDVAGPGVRGAIYAQNILSFIPAFFALINDGRVDLVELQTVERQSTTILITAFAILISLVVQALSLNLSAFHASIVLSLSWMNNTNTFIYFLLYIHHKSDVERGEQRIPPQWSKWISHVAQAFRRRTRIFEGDYRMIDLEGIQNLYAVELSTDMGDRYRFHGQ
jgi:hypothetical protein